MAFDDSPESLKMMSDARYEKMPRRAWWWWFWLFFFNNPRNPERPRQLMILWSSKNTKRIECNDLQMNLNRPGQVNPLDGAVASWYFDGKNMNHNFLLNQCDIEISDRGLRTRKPDTSFDLDKDKKTVEIGKDFRFVAKRTGEHEFTRPHCSSRKFLGRDLYSLFRINRLDLEGRVKTERIKGTAYFQRVFVSTVSPSWYWGIFHFQNGGVLTYFNPSLFGKSIKRDISFFDGSKLHEFRDMEVRLIGETPEFRISGKNDNEEINFTVSPYSHSSWSFRKKILGIVPNSLVYNEYPSVISHLELRNTKSGERLGLGDIGSSVGNAEHTTGFLL